LLSEEKYLKACSAATESEKPLCKYGPSCYRLGNAEWKAHHAHKYKHPGVALKVFILGPPQCGKTQLCSLLEGKIQSSSSHLLKSESWQLSKIVLNYPHLVQQVFDSAETFVSSPTATPKSTCSSVAEDRMNDLTNCVISSLRSSEVKQSGWILENFPRSMSQLKIMADAAALPHCVVNFEMPVHDEISEQESVFNRERQAVVAELQRLGVAVITVAPPVRSRTRSDSSLSYGQSIHEPLLPLKRTSSDTALCSARAAPPPSVTGVVSSLMEQACAGISAFLHTVPISPYTQAFPKLDEKRWVPSTLPPAHCLSFSNRNITKCVRRKHNDGPGAVWTLFHATHAAAAEAILQTKNFKSYGGPLGVGLSVAFAAAAVAIDDVMKGMTSVAGTVSEKKLAPANFSA
jgi:adenylate kinase family enzyme